MTKYLLTSLALLSAMGMTARHLSPDEALARVGNDGPRQVHAVKGKAPKLVYSAKASNLERVYLFSTTGEGFMVLSADDTTPALLAYADNAGFDFDNIPDNMRYWLDEYARQVAYAADNGLSTLENTVKERPSVEPKLTTLWDQIEPYNDQTPFQNNLPCPTGCVATAMAQIMKWHRWPEQPTGVKTYSSYYVGTLGIDFSTIRFDWDKMPDRLYYQSSSQEEIDAVATLMKACGYASEMVYHQQSSGATGYHAAEGLLTYFGYNKSMTLENREWYDIDEWDDLVYSELTENGPVYYEGTGDGGGHAFVCDGYDSATGFFHFNWGWSGKGNGYYRLSALNPDYQGIGGNSLGYNYTQDILRGLRKSDSTADEKPVYIFGPAKGVMTPWEEAELGKPVTIKGYETEDGFKNFSVVATPQVDLGVRFHNVNTGENTDVLSQNGTYDFDHYSKVNIIRYTLPTDLAEGDYSLTPIWRTEGGAWQTMRYSHQTRNYVPVTVKDNKAVFGLGEAEGRIEIKLTEAPDYFTTSGEFTIRGEIKSTGSRDFMGLLCAVFVKYDDNGQLQIIDQGASDRFDIRVNEEILDWEYTSKPQAGVMPDGDEYGIVIGNANTGELLSPIYSIKVGNRFGKLQMSTYDFAIASNYYLDPSNVQATAKIKVVAGEYDGPFAIGYSLKRSPFNAERYTYGKDVHLTAGDDLQIEINGILDNVEIGELYYAHLFYKDSDGEWAQISNLPVNVVVANSFSGVENVSAASGQATYYDTFGRTVAHPAAGNIYIRRNPDGTAVKVVY